MASPKRKLTKRLIDGTRPSDRDIFLWDTEVPGFGLRLWPSGKRIFILQYRTEHRHTRRPVIGPYGVLTVEQARAIARQWATAVPCRPKHQQQEALKAPTIADLADHYMAERGSRRSRSIASTTLSTPSRLVQPR